MTDLEGTHRETRRDKLESFERTIAAVWMRLHVRIAVDWLVLGGAHVTILLWLGAAGLLLAVTGIALPKALKPVFLALMIVATPIGIVIGEIAMLLIYFGVFFPIGLAFKLMNRDALQRKLDRNASTYWQAKAQPRNAASYYRQS